MNYIYLTQTIFKSLTFRVPARDIVPRDKYIPQYYMYILNLTFTSKCSVRSCRLSPGPKPQSEQKMDKPLSLSSCTWDDAIQDQWVTCKMNRSSSNKRIAMPYGSAPRKTFAACRSVTLKCCQIGRVSTQLGYFKTYCAENIALGGHVKFGLVFNHVGGFFLLRLV